MILAKYLKLIADFIDEKISVADFEKRYLLEFKRQVETFPNNIFHILDKLFSDVDSYDPLCTPVEDTVFRISESTLRKNAETAWQQLAKADLRAYYQSLLEQVNELPSISLRVIAYYIGHKRLIVKAESDENEAYSGNPLRHRYITFVGVSYMQLAARQNVSNLRCLSVEESKTVVAEIGLNVEQIPQSPLVIVVEGSTLLFKIVCAYVQVSEERPESSDYPYV